MLDNNNVFMTKLNKIINQIIQDPNLVKDTKEQHVDSIIILNYAKIFMILAIVFLEIHVYIYMTEQTTSPVGSCKSNGNKSNKKKY